MNFWRNRVLKKKAFQREKWKFLSLQETIEEKVLLEKVVCVTWKESWVTTSSVARAVIWQIPRRRFKSSYAITAGDNTLRKRQSLILKNSLIDTFQTITGAERRSCLFLFQWLRDLSSHTIVIDARNERNFGVELSGVCVSERAGWALFHSARRYLLVIHLTTSAIVNCLINALLCSVKKANLFYCPAAAW